MNNSCFKLKSFVLLSCLLMISISHAEEREYRSPEHVDGAITTSVLEAKKLFDQGVIFIDVRNPRYFEKAHIPKAVHLDFKYNFDESILDGVAEKDQEIVIYCSGIKCSRSYRASEQALSWGFTKVYYFRGGIAEWKKMGFDTEH